jgi:hypothetical protein
MLPCGWKPKQLSIEEAIRFSAEQHLEATSAQETIIVLREELAKLESLTAEVSRHSVGSRIHRDE